MREFRINTNDSGQRLDKFLTKAFPSLPMSLMQKYIRLKRIKINSKRTECDYRLETGDHLELYVNDELLDVAEEDTAFLTITPKLDIAYEDENILIVDKKAGVLVHSDDKESYNTLIAHIQAYLFQKKEYDPNQELSFAPALCNRLDRNTSGLVIAAKTSVALRDMNEIIKTRQVQKNYLGVVVGTPYPLEATIKGHLTRDTDEKRVYISNQKGGNSRSVTTKYKVLKSKDGLSLVEIDLITGRTHQIRAHFASIGCPLYGDGKYGNTGRIKGVKNYMLCAYKLKFDLAHYKGKLSYLDKKTVLSSQTAVFEKF